MATLFECPLDELRDYQELREAYRAKQGPFLLSGCIDTERVHVAGALTKEDPMRLWVTYNDVRARELADDAAVFGESVWLYPARDLLFYQADIQGNLLTRQRMSVLKQLLDEKTGTVILTVDALMERIMPSAALKDRLLTLMPGDQIQPDELAGTLVRLGYDRYPQVDASGQFAVRGGIIDVYPLTCENPIRIEMWGDEIDTVREFDPETQRSIENLDIVEIFPATDTPPDTITDEELVSLLTYLPKDTPIFLDEPKRLKEKADAVYKEFHESMINRLEMEMESPARVPVLLETDEVFRQLDTSRTLVMTGIEQHTDLVRVNRVYNIQAQTVPSYQGHFDALIEDLKKWKREKARVVLLAGSATRAERLTRDLRDYELGAVYAMSGEKNVEPGYILVTGGNIHKGFAYPMMRFYVLTEGDLFGKEKKKKRHKANYEGEAISSLSSLTPGDYVVHENHGLGIYRGTERIEEEGTARDYIKITYGDGGNLYIPVTQMNLVQKYAGSDAEKVPKLSRLSGNEWHKTKSRVRSAVREIAADLVKLYSARQNGAGFVYDPDTVWQREFEEQFPFEETEDQLAAIEATKADMESGRIMDRLICGDVGFGKTEIAIRAAFKAVQDSKQVVYLVPTTILAQQHYNTFAQRLKDYPVSVELLCRFRSTAEQKKTVARLKSGEADIVIGTHRLLSKDVSFKDLGLLIIDEEQRFGVSDKEKIKQLKQSVDVLSLTATPIPRTLHMSLIGIRDMSILREAPMDRVPIQTYVMEYNDELVREAISRELERGGQVYYVYNRVNNIAEITARIQGLVPDANVAFAHGQMKEAELERIMLEFINGDIDVLVSTTIVETGLDISNVNTILIDDADRFGLSQLYQLRGRVGRSNRTAYAFLMYKRDKTLKEIAEKRLSTIKEYTELGSGIKIAMRDLELRGAGNILGAEQHGHMEAVGYDLYCKMLGTAVKEMKGEADTEKDEYDTEIDLTIDAYLPDRYVKNESQRMGIYRRIAEVEDEDALYDIQEELIDRFGDIPKPVQNLVRIALLKAAAHEAFITKVEGDRQTVEFTMYEKTPADPEKIAPLISKYRGDMKVSVGDDIVFTYRDQRRKNGSDDQFLDNLRDMIRDIAELTRKVVNGDGSL